MNVSLAKSGRVSGLVGLNSQLELFHRCFAGPMLLVIEDPGAEWERGMGVDSMVLQLIFVLCLT